MVFELEWNDQKPIIWDPEPKIQDGGHLSCRVLFIFQFPHTHFIYLSLGLLWFIQKFNGSVKISIN